MILRGQEIYYKLRTTDIRSIRKNLTMLKKEKNLDQRQHTDEHIATDHCRSNYRDSTVILSSKEIIPQQGGIDTSNLRLANPLMYDQCMCKVLI